MAKNKARDNSAESWNAHDAGIRGNCQGVLLNNRETPQRCVDTEHFHPAAYFTQACKRSTPPLPLLISLTDSSEMFGPLHTSEGAICQINKCQEQTASSLSDEEAGDVTLEIMDETDRSLVFPPEGNTHGLWARLPEILRRALLLAQTPRVRGHVTSATGHIPGETGW
ncbi:unnamed protein product [Pleuronectes platessa]|uniref:Uncharacterized protein n=1 Tax=Pleuronectes platessa TaxID=8262 RepID=A0A9N7YPE3_PLEPL|nr:unnamed protein product [Pleuronectes platessa]